MNPEELAEMRQRCSPGGATHEELAGSADWEDPHAEFLDALMEGACDCFDGDESMEDLALRYVRHLESMLSDAARCVRTFDDSCYYVPEPKAAP